MAKPTMKHSSALRAGILDGLASTGAFVVRALTHGGYTVRERATYRGEGIRGDVKAIGRDMRKSAKRVLAER